MPPKQVLFNDPTHTTYDYWDLRMLKAYYFAQDFIREGIPIWWDESDGVGFDVERRISKSKAAVANEEKKETGKDKTPPPGRYYVPIPKTRDGKPLPTFAEWQDEQARKKPKK